MTPRIRADMIQNLHGADQDNFEGTDATRTERSCVFLPRGSGRESQSPPGQIVKLRLPAVDTQPWRLVGPRTSIIGTLRGAVSWLLPRH
jgi:hypothetical protein